MAKEQLSLLLSELGENTGIEGLSLDADGFCSLMCDARITLNIQYDAVTDNLLLFSEIGKVEADSPAEIYSLLLKANLFWQGTGGGTLGLETQTRAVVLSYQEALASMGYQRFEQVFEGFINTVEFWISHLERVQQNRAAAAQDFAIGSSWIRI